MPSDDKAIKKSEFGSFRPLKWMSIAFIVILGFFACISIVHDRNIKHLEPTNGIIAYLNEAERPSYLDLGITTLASITQDETGFKNIANQARSVAKDITTLNLPFGIFKKSDKSLYVARTRTDLISSIQNLYLKDQNRSRPRIQFGIGVIAWLLGVTLLKRMSRLGPFVVAACGLTASALLNFRCHTCPIPEGPFGLDMAKVAVLTFGLACIAPIVIKKPVPMGAYAGLLLASSVVQLWLFHDTTTTCQYCLTIFAMSAAYLGSVISADGQTMPTAFPNWARTGLALAGILCVGAFISSFFIEKERSTKAKTFEHKTAHYQSIIGKKLSEVGILYSKKGLTEKSPAVLVVGSKSCQPCLLARLWASTQSGIDSEFVNQFPSKEDIDQKIEPLLDPKAPIPFTTPTVLLVKDGKVIDCEYGWAEDDQYKAGLAKRFADSSSR